jgi:hypothetical protein
MSIPETLKSDSTPSHNRAQAVRDWPRQAWRTTKIDEGAASDRTCQRVPLEHDFVVRVWDAWPLDPDRS